MSSECVTVKRGSAKSASGFTVGGTYGGPIYEDTVRTAEH